MHWVTTLFIFVRQLDASWDLPCEGGSHTLDCSLSNKWISWNWRTQQFIHTVEIIIDKISTNVDDYTLSRSSHNCAPKDKLYVMKWIQFMSVKGQENIFIRANTYEHEIILGSSLMIKHSTNTNILIREMIEDDVSSLWCLLGCQRLLRF